MRTKYKLLSLILITAALFICSCSKAPPVSLYSPRQISEAIITAQENIATLHPLPPNDDYYAEYIANIYQIDGDLIEDGMIHYPYGVSADEIAVFIANDSAGAKSIRSGLLEYIGRRAALFSGYAPTQAAKAQSGIVMEHGNYVALIICEDIKSAESVFVACFSGSLPRLSDSDDSARLPDRAESSDTAENPDGRPGETSDRGEPSGTGATPEPSQQTGNNMPPDSQDNADKKTPDGTNSTTGPGTSADQESTKSAAASQGASDGTDGTESPGTAGNPGGTINPGTAPSDPGASTGPGTAANPAPSSDPGASTGPGATPGPDKPTGDISNDLYNPVSILAAWKSGNAASLTYKNKSIFDACGNIIRRLITADMTDYEKELAIHDWIIDWGRYDIEVMSNSPDAAPDPDNDNPYGLMINKKAICKGFATTFQLFMDMIGIECITIDGTSVPGDNAHAWNMVQIGGEWYCVDVTWDNPSDSINANRSHAIKHKYFNVTSDFMWETGHRWDRSAAPEATAPKLYRLYDKVDLG